MSFENVQIHRVVPIGNDRRQEWVFALGYLPFESSHGVEPFLFFRDKKRTKFG